MKRAFATVLGLTLIASCGPAWADMRQAAAAASATILETGGIEIVTPLALPTVQLAGVPGGAGLITGNAQLTVHGEAGDVLSMAVPDKLTLVRAGGGEALTADTSAAFGLMGRGVLMGGEIINGNAMSVDIGGKLSLASANHLVPGPYEGLFVVVVQYN
jgi:hypothetical protein